MSAERPAVRKPRSTGRRVTISDIAAKAGVHRSTVSLALREDPRIPPATQNRIRAIANELNYRPNIMARGLAGQGTNSVGILITKMHDDFFLNIVAQQQDRLWQSRIATALVTSRGEGDTERFAIEELYSRGVDGILLNYLPEEKQTLALIERLTQEGRSMVGLGEHPFKSIDSVSYDVRSLANRLTAHLLSLGHRRIGITVYSPNCRRVEGYKQALSDFGVSFDRSLVFVIDFANPNVVELRERMMARPNPPTALLAYNDNLAAEIVSELLAAGFGVPDDVSVAGFIDTWFSPLVKVPLTTARLPQIAMADAAVDMMVERIEANRKGEALPPRRQTFAAELIARASTAPPRRK